MRVIYATSELDEWIDLAKEMQKDRGWKAIYWVTTAKNNHKIKSAFPSSYTQNYIDAVRGIYSNIGIKKRIPLDRGIILRYHEYEKVALKMMDRMDATGYSFNYAERLELYYDFLGYWINALKVLKADYVLFSESPHALFTYILYAVCMESGVRVLRYTPTHIGGLTFLSHNIERTPPSLMEMLKLDVPQGELTQTYLDKNRGLYSEALPYYMKDLTKKNGLWSGLKKYGGKLQRLLSYTPQTAYKKNASSPLSQSDIGKIHLLLYKLKGLMVKAQLKKSYEALTTEVDLGQPYVYVALHYQPEKTTSPEGDIFVEQWLMVQMLSHLLPEGWWIYLKEHGSQFNEKLYGEQGRTHDFYKRINVFDNVKLLPTNMDSFELIDHAKVVATVTGTVGIEAVIRSTPLLSFGHAWYALCEGVFVVKNQEELRDALQQIDNGYMVESSRVDAFLYAIERISFPCYLNPGNRAGVSFGSKENLENLVRCLKEYADNE